MTIRTTYKGFSITKENNQYDIHDDHGFWLGFQYTLAFAKERVDEILEGRGSK